MIKFKWSINQLDRKTVDGFITTAHWQCVAIDGDYSASIYATCSFTEPEFSDDMTPYEKITEADVLSWVWDSGVDKSSTEAALVVQIEAQKNPVVVAGLPWA